MSEKKILMIDDDPDFTSSVETIVTARGYKFDFSLNGEEGIKKAKVYLPDLIILDVMMTKNTEGFEVSRILPQEELLKSIPVILLTGIRDKMNLVFGFEPDSTWLQ